MIKTFCYFTQLFPHFSQLFALDDHQKHKHPAISAQIVCQYQVSVVCTNVSKLRNRQCLFHSDPADIKLDCFDVHQKYRKFEFVFLLHDFFRKVIGYCLAETQNILVSINIYFWFTRWISLKHVLTLGIIFPQAKSRV